ncbi:1-deoxy-D-xylulose-5-phosphate reductoisomerase [Thermotomaculum hydrothermale]|uniref:1-deoxy-D-xylulose 5-phosphate reductoisomerase n=1 Tax=Thermotomaculum hydrothermale TaxID=981385 RepID=A0A7R6SYE8_9BACT|nr:1-deoxy-D-xylulose-5-phosphate reductoisomerase [Thermotomaculum hydrothermale]BBB32699.1 1-deoxy-D-xylulose-5-phosphate reductoisomerase [Thermotomaculum hydrothermale]
MKTLKIYGSTGSIGKSCLKLLKLKREDFSVKLLAAGNNIDLLKEQIVEFQPEFATIFNGEKAKELKTFLENLSIKTSFIPFEESFSLESDITLSAIVGSAGLIPTFKSIPYTKRLALANKESMVLAGEFVNSECEKYNTELIPVDSEHNAIHQSLRAGKKHEVKSLILTASGGPFFGKGVEELKNVTVAQTLNHPTWDMGQKITVDSATLMNKGLEVIEAHFLFGIDYDKINVRIHPQSVVHSMVEFIDGSIICQMGKTDMMLPIQYALYFPERVHTEDFSFDFGKALRLDFFEPDIETFKSLKLAYKCGKGDIGDRVILNSANEVAVNYFLDEKIKFLQIPEFIERMLDKIERPVIRTIGDVIDFNERVKNICIEEVKSGNF